MGWARKMSGFEATRKITLMLWCLRHLLRGARSKLSDPAIAKLLNDAQAGGVRPFTVDKNSINKMRNGKYSFHGSEETQLLHALQTVCDNNEIEIDLNQELPRWVEEGYSRDLPDIFERPEWLPLEGQPLGATAGALTGLWHFMYLSPVDRKGKFKPEIRATAAIFYDSHEDESTVDCILVSKNGCWYGHAFINESHMYLILTDRARAETAFFVTNKPSTNEVLIAGVGAALERDHTRRRRVRRAPVLGVVCFGEKIPTDSTSAGAKAALHILNAGGVNQADEETIRKTFCAKYDQKEFQQKHPVLHKYLQQISVNGTAGISSVPALYLAYK